MTSFKLIFIHLTYNNKCPFTIREHFTKPLICIFCVCVCAVEAYAFHTRGEYLSVNCICYLILWIYLFILI